jgi:peptide-methionine (S)-S-oxide reductase
MMKARNTVPLLFSAPKKKNRFLKQNKKAYGRKEIHRKIVTEVVPFTKFYKGEDYHQEYINRHPENPYVRNVSIPDYIKFRSEFKAVYKDKS